jgi:hypothetical protein
MNKKALINSISYNLIGIFGTVLGIGMFAGSLYLYSTAIEEPDDELHIFETTTHCNNYANNFHNSNFSVNDKSIYNAIIRNDLVLINKEEVINGKDELLEIENIISNCKNMELINFCLGQAEVKVEDGLEKHGCKKNGLNVTLKYKETWTYKPVF